MQRSCVIVLVWLVVVGLAARPGLAQPRLGGFVEYDNLTYFESADRRQINGRNQAIFQTEVRHEAGARANLFAAVELRYDEADPARNRIFLDEAYLDLYLGAFDVRVGRQIYAWGRADGFNPTDNLTARDFSDVLDFEDEELGLVSMRAGYFVGDWVLEAVLAPGFTPSVFPRTDSRWWPELPPLIPNPAFPALGPPELAARYTLAEARLPDEGVKSAQYAARVSGLIQGWDVSLSWFDGFDDLPALHTTPTLAADASEVQVLVEPRYHRRRALGADFATALRGIGVHGEAAYYLTEDSKGTDPAVDDPYLHVVLGADHTFDGFGPDRELFVLLEWAQEVQLPNRHAVYRDTDLNHLFRKSLLGKIDLGLGAFATVKLTGFYNVATDDWWLQPGVSWSVTDGVQVRLEVDLLGGPDDSLFGSLDDNNRVHLRMKYSF